MKLYPLKCIIKLFNISAHFIMKLYLLTSKIKILIKKIYPIFFFSIMNKQIFVTNIDIAVMQTLTALDDVS